MAEEFNTNPNTSSKYGLTTGISIAFVLSVSYAVIVTVCLSLAMSFGSSSYTDDQFIELLFAIFAILIVGLGFGLIPSLVIGGLAGLSLSIIFARFGKSLTERRVIGTGFLVGIICVFLLHLFLHMITDGKINDIPSLLANLHWTTMSIYLIMLFGIVWIARKVGKPYL